MALDRRLYSGRNDVAQAGAYGSLGSRRWPSTTAAAMSTSLRLAVARLLAQHLEGARLVDRVAFHQDALGALGERAAPEGAFEVVVLGEPAQHDVDRALPVVASASVM